MCAACSGVEVVANHLRLTVGLRLLALSCLCCCFMLVRPSKVAVTCCRTADSCWAVELTTFTSGACLTLICFDRPKDFVFSCW